ncbi:LOW QUALITY PROTEIN: hypothetical protein MAR_035996 [Mya arenaria]|uniref:Uncharacterized protein n=1 Tax=Mya arenaria TaxID=6604 RepID=A0ABY7EM73_MYAAR|nr:LOW QUALITY PROTEIN: hypothetical protein MAR_035996 [Mya arenaria]
MMQCLPDLYYYAPNGMKPEGKTYTADQMLIFYKSAPEIQGAVYEPNELDDRHGILLFEKCITIASACNLDDFFIQRKHCNHITSWLPSRGKEIYCGISVVFLFGSQKRVIHSTWKNIGPYKVDGYNEHNGERIVLECHGCFWHGCPKCFSKTTINPVSDMSMGDLYARTLEKKGLKKTMVISIPPSGNSGASQPIRATGCFLWWAYGGIQTV